jgi:hypothetical protein
MPYSVQEDAGMLRVRYSGRLTGADVHESLSEMDALVQPRERWPDNLVDMRGADISALGFPDIMSVAKRREAVTPPNPIRTAIVADHPSILGFARMFQSLNHNPNITIQVFADHTEAMTWLQAQPRTV